jgi:hypothetical protein
MKKPTLTMIKTDLKLRVEQVWLLISIGTIKMSWRSIVKSKKE